ncbi:MAG: tetratricopeptide repeat protein [Leptolyngbya sp. SIO4C1]|nr:tetratricopeptide repeat protein [Leptolyngbya sp. SIO4C1]
MGTASFDRALLLFEQSRFAQAESTLRSLLSEAPENARAQALLAITLTRLERYAEAIETGQQAIAAEPDMPFAHYALADVHYHRDAYPEAEQAITAALQLDPMNESFYSLQGGIFADQERWPAALAAAEKGLAIDATHTGCSTLRALCLKQLNRLEEAAASIESSLLQDPENALAHANQGWLWLDRGQPKQAQVSFQEALRLQPDLDWARRGMIQSLKATNVVYGAFLRYALWMSKLSEGRRWLVIALLVVGFRILRIVAQTGPIGMAVAAPLIFLYLSFVLFSWVADPLFNLLLRFNRYGRLLLSKDELAASNWIGGLLLTALLIAGSAIALQSWLVAVGCAIALGMIIPTSAVYQCSAGWPRQTMIVYSGSMAGLALLGWALLWIPTTQSGGIVLLALFVLGFLASSLVANVLVNRTPRKG